MNLLAAILRFFPEPLHVRIERLQSSPIARRLIGGAYWAFIGTAIARGVTLISSIIVVRVLGKVEYGELAIVISTVTVFQTFAAFGLGVTSSKYVAEFRLSDPDKAADIMAMSATISIFTGIMASLAMYFTASYLSNSILGAPHLSRMLQISFLLPLFQVITTTQLGTLSGLEAFRRYALAAAICSTLSVPLIIVGVIWYGMEGALYAYLAFHIYSCLFNHVVIRYEAKLVGIPIRFFARHWHTKLLWRFSMPAMLTSVVGLPINWVCGVMLVNQADGYAQNGLFSAANQWFTAAMLLAGIASQAVLPVLSECIGRGDREKAQKVFKAAIRANSLVVLPVVVGGSIISPFLMGIYGAEFRAGWPTLAVCLATAGIIAVQAPAGYVMTASDRLWTAFAMNVAWAGAILISTYFLVSFGAIGVATGRFFAYLLLAAISIWYADKKLNLQS